ncbi:MAG: LamG domain-containing protein, partial [Planctomycetota bacterium]|nr:LamG domain-containing protein [Planctomycetota bacterium]
MSQQSVPYRNPVGVLAGAIACLLITQLVAASATGADNYEQLILADRPVAYWRCNASGSNEAINSGAAGKSATGAYRSEVEFVDGLPGTAGKAAKFNGRNTHIQVPMIKALQLDTLSIEFWFKTTQKFDNAFWRGSAAFLTIATSGDGSSDFTINAASTKRGEDQGRILVCTGPAGTGRDNYLLSPSDYRLNDGRWHHVVAARTFAGEKHLYIDGRIAASSPDVGGRISSDRPLQIGGEQHHPGGRYLDGVMDEIAIYPHILSAERIAAHYAAVKKHLAPRDVAFAKVEPQKARPVRPTNQPPAVSDLSVEQKLIFFEAKIR